MRRIILFAGHPFDVILFAGIMNLLKAHNKTPESLLIIADHPYFKTTKKIGLFMHYFNKVEHVGMCGYHRNIFYGTPLLKNYCNQIKRININSNDIVISAAASELINNIFFNYVKRNNAASILIRQGSPADNTEDVGFRENFTVSIEPTLYR